MVSRLDFFMVANKLVSQYKIYVETGFFTPWVLNYKSFQAVNKEMTNFPKLFPLKLNLLYYEFIQKEVIRWFDGTGR